MANLFPIEKQQKHPIFGRFNARYGDTIVDTWPQLGKFTIQVLTAEEFKADTHSLPPVDDIEEQPFFCSSDQTADKAETTIAGIMFSPQLIDRYGLIEEEQIASIAHEIGHIILRFREKDGNYEQPQSIEIFADKIACQLGLAKPLLSTIEKIENSGVFTDCLSRFGMRKLMITSMNLDTIDE